jgi:hypothetical protein
MPISRRDYIKADHYRVTMPGLLRSFTITVLAVFTLVGAGFQSAGAQPPGQPVINPAATDSEPVSAITNTVQNTPSTTGEQPISQPTATSGNLVSTPTHTGQNTPATAGEQPISQPTATAGNLVSTSTNTSAGKPEPRMDLCAAAEVEGSTWLDQTHDFVGRQLCEPAVWFDSFFAQDRALEDVRPGAFIKWRNSARWTEGQGLTLLRDFSFRYRLPNLDRLMKKARLVIESRSTADKFTTQPGQAVDPGLDPATGARSPTIGVRADFFTRLRSLASFDVGIKARWPLDPFARLRYQYTMHLGELYLIRFNETALYRRIEHFSETSELDLERKITTFTLVRWANYATYTEGTAGVTWNTGISLITQLTPKSAISYDTSMWGVSHPDWVVQNYRIGSLYRRNFYRPWLFFELSPEVTWPKDASGQRNSTFAFTATLEAQFGK